MLMQYINHNQSVCHFNTDNSYYKSRCDIEMCHTTKAIKMSMPLTQILKEKQVRDSYASFIRSAPPASKCWQHTSELSIKTSIINRPLGPLPLGTLAVDTQARPPAWMGGGWQALWRHLAGCWARSGCRTVWHHLASWRAGSGRLIPALCFHLGSSSAAPQGIGRKISDNKKNSGCRLKRKPPKH